MPNMPVGYPTESDFLPAQIRQKDETWKWERDAGSGGKNYGKDFTVDDGYFVVGYDVIELSRRRMEGDPAISLYTQIKGLVNVPRGVHNGCRLNPEGITGAGAAYKFTVQMKYVTEDDWYGVLQGSGFVAGSFQDLAVISEQK